MISSQLLHHVRNGGIVAYPTSTLPGLACLPEARSLDRLFDLKQRPSDKPVSLGVLSLEQATDLVHVPEKVRQLEAAFPKGGFTFILDAVEPLDARLGGERVAVRCLAHPTARLLVEAFGPITATSANESGEIPASTAEEAGATLGLPAHAILSGVGSGGMGSTILSIIEGDDGAEVTVMREGIVPTHSVVQWWKNPT